MEGGQQYNPRTVEEVCRDFKGRRAGLIKALTTDVEEFYQQCDPGLTSWWYHALWYIKILLKKVAQRGSEPPPKYSRPQPKDEYEDGLEEEEDDEQGETLCGACGENYASDEFWICCDICENWFHGKCVKITPARAEHIKQYKCPACSNKRART